MRNCRTPIVSIFALVLCCGSSEAGRYRIDPANSTITLDSITVTTTMFPGGTPALDVFGQNGNFGATSFFGDGTSARVGGFLDVTTTDTSISVGAGEQFDLVASGLYVPVPGGVGGLVPTLGDFGVFIPLGSGLGDVTASIRDFVGSFSTPGSTALVPSGGGVFDFDASASRLNLEGGTADYAGSGSVGAFLPPGTSPFFAGDVPNLATNGVFDTSGLPTITVPVEFDVTVDVVTGDPNFGDVSFTIAGSGQIQASVPEIDPSASVAALIALGAGLLFVADRRRKVATANS